MYKTMEAIMSKEKISGIYCIKNLINHKKYIGQSCNIKKRLSEHRRRLNCKDSHENRHLQRAWDKYGEENFSFSIIEYCDKCYLDEREIYWINYYNSSCDKNGYNAELGGSKNNKKLSKLTKKQISKTLKEQRNSQEYKDVHSGANAPFKKKCICVNTQQIFPTAKAAANYMNINYSVITDCCRNKIKQVNGLQFQYYEEGKEYNLKSLDRKIRERNKFQRKIVQFDKNFNYICEYESSYDIVENYHKSWNRDCIIATCNGNQIKYRDFIFMYKDEIGDIFDKEHIKNLWRTKLLNHKKFSDMII